MAWAPARDLTSASSDVCRARDGLRPWCPRQGNERVGHDEDHTHGSADRGDPGRRQGQAAEVRPPEGPASDLRQAGAVARPAGGARRETVEDRGRGRTRRRRRSRRRRLVGSHPEAGVRRAGDAARHGSRRRRRREGGRAKRRRPGARRRLRPPHRRRRQGARPHASPDQERRDHGHSGGRRPGRLRPCDPRRRPARRDRRARRRDAGAACDPRGLAARDGLPAGGSVPRRSRPSATTTANGSSI